MDDLGLTASTVLARANLPIDSLERVMALCRGYRERVKQEEEAAHASNERSSLLVAGVNAVADREEGARIQLQSDEIRHWDRIDRFVSDYRERTQRDKERHQRRQELEHWRDVQVRRLEQERFRLVHKAAVDHGGLLTRK